MTEIIHAIIPILLLIALGYILGKINFLSENQSDGLSKLTFTLFIPCLLFLSIYQNQDLSGVSIELLLAFYIPVFIVYLLSYSFFKVGFNKTFPKTELLSLASTFSNNVLIGIPVLLSLIGEEIILPAFVIVSVHSLLLFTLTSYFAAFTQSSNSRWYQSVAKSIWLTSRSPIVISLILGLIFKWFSISIPGLLLVPMTTLKHAALPCALLVLGMTLSKYTVSKNIQLNLLVSSFKLLLLPLLIWFFGHYVFTLPSTLISVTVIMSASPVGINVFMFASQDKESSPYLASTVLISTLLSLITIPLWITFSTP